MALIAFRQYADPRWVDMEPVVAPPFEYRLWVPALISLMALILGIINFYRGVQNHREGVANRDAIQKLDRIHKARIIRLEEFRKYIRDPMRSAALELRPLVKKVRALSQTRSPINELVADISGLNKEVMEKIGVLIDSAIDANRSAFSNGIDYGSKVTAAEDEVGECFNIALSESLPQIRRFSALATAATTIEAMITHVLDETERALEAYASEVDLPQS